MGEIWGQTIETYFDSNDGGRDGAFHGRWISSDGKEFVGTFTAQCKFTSRRDEQSSSLNLSDEFKKAKRLAARGLADKYVLFTNANLTGTHAETLKARFEEIEGIQEFSVYGKERISQIIHESPRLRLLVPRIYGLGDLSQILDERGYDQAIEILSAFGDDLSKFVITDAYKKAAKSLAKHGFVVLLGEPASGKSTIAAALSLGALDEWGCRALKPRDADEFVQRWNPNEPKQFFWIDDVFGATQYDWASAAKWNSAFPHLNAAIRRGARVVFTSRDYIYRAARNHLKVGAFPLLNEAQVAIQVEKLTKEEREQILYNHMRLGTQPKQFKTRIKPYLTNIAQLERFSPEVARRLSDPIFTKKLVVSEAGLTDFVVRPMEFLEEVIRTLDSHSRAALAAIFMKGGAMTSPMELSAEEANAIETLGSTTSTARSAIGTLHGSLVKQVKHEGSIFWRFKHPTIQDAFASLISADRELMDIYLKGAPIERVFSEVTCGDVGIEGVKVVVPKDRYEMMVYRLDSYYRENRGRLDKLYTFLAYRCDREFLAHYCAVNQALVENLNVGSYLYAVSDVDLLVRLHEFGLLPEPIRLKAFEFIQHLAVNVPDAGFLDPTISPLLTKAEIRTVLDRVRKELVPKLDETIEDWRYQWDRDSDPEDHFYELVSALKSYSEAFTYEEICGKLDSALEHIDGIVEELKLKLPREPEYDELYGDDDNASSSFPARSIFDDVDH